MPDRPTVSVIIVSYNSRPLLARCLDSVQRASRQIDAEVIVCDNASDDGSADLVETSFPIATLLRSPSNRGFAAAVNEAARRASGRFLLLLNPDAELRPGAIGALVEMALRRAELGLVGGRTLRADGTLDPRSCWGFPSPWSLFCFGTGLSTAFRGSVRFDPESLGRWLRDDERLVDAVSGALLLIDRSLWERLGGFDETYFMYSEDIDLARRALDLGRAAAVAPQAVATHVVGASSTSAGDKMVLVMQGKATYLRQHWSPAGRRFGACMLWLGSALRALGEVAAGRHGQWRAVWRARRVWRPGYPTRGGAAGPSVHAA
jgi:hypothetical protein